MSMCNDTDRENERQHRDLCAQCQRSGRICDTTHAMDIGVSGRPRQKTRVGTRIPRVIVALQMVDTSKCHTSRPIFPATLAVTLRKLGVNYHVQGTCENQKILIKTKGKQTIVYLQVYLPVEWYSKFGTHTKKIGRNRASDFDP